MADRNAKSYGPIRLCHEIFMRSAFQRRGDDWLCMSDGFHNVKITDCVPAASLPTPEDEAKARKKKFERKRKKPVHRGFSKEAAERGEQHTEFKNTYRKFLMNIARERRTYRSLFPSFVCAFKSWSVTILTR